MQVRTAAGTLAETVALAESPWARLRGVIGGGVHPTLFRTSSVHGFWLRRPIGLVGIDRGGTVTHSRVLRRRRVAWLRGAHWVLELPGEAPRPPVGERLTLWGAPGEPDGHARPPVPVRYADRQSR